MGCFHAPRGVCWSLARFETTVESTPLKVGALPELAIQVLHQSRDSVPLLSTGDNLPLNVCLFIRRGFKTITLITDRRMEERSAHRKG